jgi:hypothetical protein
VRAREMSLFLIVRLNEMRKLTEAQRGGFPGSAYGGKSSTICGNSLCRSGWRQNRSRPRWAYAMTKTGLAVTEDDKHLLSEAELDEWTDAIEEAQTKIRD